MSAPTDNDWASFRQEKTRDKVDVLFEYCCKGSDSMNGIAESVLGVDGASVQRVSCITRCYDFGGNNRGIFKKMNVTRKDVEAFVKTYPDGVDYEDGRGTVMRQFLEERLEPVDTGAPFFINPSELPKSSGTAEDSQDALEGIAVLIVMCILAFNRKHFGFHGSFFSFMIVEVVVLAVGIVAWVCFRRSKMRPKSARSVESFEHLSKDVLANDYSVSQLNSAVVDIDYDVRVKILVCYLSMGMPFDSIARYVNVSKQNVIAVLQWAFVTEPDMGAYSQDKGFAQELLDLMVNEDCPGELILTSVKRFRIKENDL